MNAILVLAALATTAAPNFQSVLDQMSASQQIPGVSAVVTHENRVLFAGASGTADLESSRAMTADTPLYAGSLSKVFTAVLTLHLVEDDKLSLQDAVGGIESESGRDMPSINVFHLLTHAAGLEREGNFDYWFTADFPNASELARYLRGTELRSAPGTSLHYSNIGYAALGPVIKLASGETYAKALRTRVLEPLRMTSSGVPGPRSGIATGYTPVGRIIPNEERPFAGVGRAVGERHVREYHDAGAMAPAFGVYTSARDLGRLARFLLGYNGDSVLSQDMRKRMRSKQESGWGLGLKIGTFNNRPISRHEGWFAAHRSHMLLDSRANIGVVVLANSDSAAPAKIAEVLLLRALEFSSQPLP